MVHMKRQNITLTMSYHRSQIKSCRGCQQSGLIVQQLSVFPCRLRLRLMNDWEKSGKRLFYEFVCHFWIQMPLIFKVPQYPVQQHLQKRAHHTEPAYSLHRASISTSRFIHIVASVETYTNLTHHSRLLFIQRVVWIRFTFFIFLCIIKKQGCLTISAPNSYATN